MKYVVKWFMGVQTFCAFLLAHSDGLFIFDYDLTFKRLIGLYYFNSDVYTFEGMLFT